MGYASSIAGNNIGWILQNIANGYGYSITHDKVSGAAATFPCALSLFNPVTSTNGYILLYSLRITTNQLSTTGYVYTVTTDLSNTTHIDNQLTPVQAAFTQGATALSLAKAWCTNGGATVSPTITSGTKIESILLTNNITAEWLSVPIIIPPGQGLVVTPYCASSNYYGCNAKWLELPFI